MKKILLLIIILTATFFSLNHSNAQITNKTVLAILPLSGPQAKFGTAVKRGIELAIEDHQSKNPELPKVNFQFEDHQGKPANAATIFEAKTSSSPPDAIIIFGSTTSLAIAQKCQDKEIPMISIATSNKIQEGRSFVFRHMTASDTMARLITEEMRKENISKVSSITTIHDGMYSFQDAFKKAFKDPLVSFEEVSPEESDLKTSALNITKKNPEAVFITLMPPQASLFAKAIRGIGYKGKLFAANQIDDSSERAAAGTAFEGLIFCRDGKTNPEEFNKKFIERFKEESETFAGNGYDVGVVIQWGLASNSLPKYLNEVSSFNGILGTYSMLPNRSFDVPGSLWSIKSGRLVKVD